MPENQAFLNSNITAGLLLKGNPGVRAQCGSNCRVNAFISDTLNGGLRLYPFTPYTTHTSL